jgi:hypothetical protein
MAGEILLPTLGVSRMDADSHVVEGSVDHLPNGSR